MLRTTELMLLFLLFPDRRHLRSQPTLPNGVLKGIWNFSHVDLDLPKEVVVENVHLTDSLMTLLYKINEVNNESEA